MYILLNPYNLMTVTPGEYDFSIIETAIIEPLNIMQVAYELTDINVEYVRYNHIEEYKISTDENSDFYKIMEASHTSVHPGYIVKAETKDLILTCGKCKVVNDTDGKPKIDIASMDYSATMCGEIGLYDNDNDC